MDSPHARTWRSLAVLLIVAVSCLRILYLTFDCRLDLAPDEAHYWDWSRHLDWSYYSKGPLVAVLIRLSCALFGESMLALRLPAVICGALFLSAAYILAWQIYRRDSLAFAVVAGALTLPPIAAGGLIMTIDAPYACCWAWALVLAHRAVERRQSWCWPMLGFVVGLGILAKYTMVLFLPSLGLFLLSSRDHRRLLLRPGFWIMTLIAGLCCLPILIWNLNHDWVSFRHVNSLAGQQSARWRWEGPLVYVGVQFALLLGWWFVGWVRALIAHAPWREADAGKRFLWWMSVPMFVVFLVFSVKTGGGEPNWPITAYISGLILTAGWLAEQFRSSNLWYRRLAFASVATACLTGMAVTLFAHGSHLFYPWMANLIASPSAARPTPLRAIDPTCRLRGWRTLAAEVEQLRQRLREEDGCDPVIAAARWSLPGELGFYLKDHPPVYSLGAALGDRHSQYDFWRPNPTADSETFAGRTFIVVGAGTEVQSAFEEVDKPRRVIHWENGEPVAEWTIMIGRGYRGFRLAEKSPSQKF